MWRGVGAKGVEEDDGKECGGGWGQRVWRRMGEKGVEGTKNVKGVGPKVVEGGGGKA